MVQEPDEEMFTSGTAFNFEAPVPSPRMTRARRASMNFDVVAKPNKRMSLAPSLGKVEEISSGRGRRRSMAPNASSGKAKELSVKAKATTKRRSLAVPVKKDLATPKRRSKKAPVVVVEEAEEESPEFIFDPRPSRTITPVNVKTMKAVQSPVKAAQESSTPKREAVKVSNFYSSSPGLGLKKKGSQLQLTGSPKKTSSVQASPTKKFSKNSSRILTEEDIEARLMAEFDSPPAEARIQPKTFETDIPTEKVKPRRREVMIKSPVVKAAKKEKKSRIPIKSPPMTPIKNTFVPQILPAGSPVINSILAEIKKVEVRLSPHRIKEDPNVIFSMLEEEHANKDRVKRVVQALVSKSQEKRAKTRKSFEKTVKPAEADKMVTPLNKPLTKKTVSGTIVPPVEKTVQTPKSAKVGRPKKEAQQTKIETSKTAPTPKSSQTPKMKKVSTPSKLNVSVNSQTSTVNDTAVLMKKTDEKVKLEAEQTKAKKSEKENTKPKEETRGTKRPLETTPMPSNKKLRVEKPFPKVKSATPKAATPASKMTPKTNLSGMKKKTPRVTPMRSGIKKSTPGPKDPLSAVKKPLKRLTKAAAVTPAQVKPSDVLRRNLKRQVETAIIAKVAAKPDSSPYTMDTTENNSPVFRRVEKESENVVKEHLTGTPARAPRSSRSRKFGTVVQPSSLGLLDASSLPSERRSSRSSVSSSTPVRPVHPLATPAPHPLESVEATPIKAPSPEKQATSPAPQMLTGGLHKMCAIM